MICYFHFKYLLGKYSTFLNVVNKNNIVSVYINSIYDTKEIVREDLQNKLRINSDDICGCYVKI